MSGKKDVWNAVISTVLGTIGSSLAPQQKKLAELGEQSKEWTDKAKNLGKTLYDDVKHWNEPKPDIAKRNFLAGTLMGLLLGAGSAAFLNTKSGKKIKKGVSGTYEDVSEKTQEIVDYINELAHSQEKKVKRVVKSAPKKIKHEVQHEVAAAKKGVRSAKTAVKKEVSAVKAKVKKKLK